MKFAKRLDVIIVIALLAAGLVLWAAMSGVIGKTEGARAEIYYNSELVKTIDLAAGKDAVFTIEQLPRVLFRIYEDGSIAFIESDCPDQVCVKTGRLHYTGQTAACLPNHVYVKIVGKAASAKEPDIVIN